MYKWANGNVYEGEKMMLMMLSMVMMVISTCIITIGQLKNDKKEGHGVFRYADGEMYEGE